MVKTIERIINTTANPNKQKQTNTHNIKRVVAYCRVSSLKEEQELSFESQKKYYETLLADATDKELICVYGDEGISGLQANKRPAFQEMIKECKRGNIDEIYTKSVSRFARNYSECLKYARELRSLGICIYFEKEGFSTFDKNIDMFFGLMAILAQEESNSISQALCWAIEKRRESGDPIQAACYGYRRDDFLTDNIHKWHIVDTEAIRVRKIFKLYNEGLSLVRIANELTSIEKLAGNNIIWKYSRVGYILNNVAYIGDLYCGKSYTIDYLSKKTVKNNGERSSYYIHNHHEAIITREEFERAREIRIMRKQKRCK